MNILCRVLFLGLSLIAISCEGRASKSVESEFVDGVANALANDGTVDFGHFK